jgi:uncharacterized protein (TIGR03435 family)
MYTMRSCLCAAALTLLAGAAFGQSGSTSGFEVADVHASAKAPNTFMRISPARNGRYEIKNATMLDLVRTAYGFNPDTIVGGPNWLELDRFDVIAKVPAGADNDTQKAMLQSLLQERFKLVARKEMKPVPTWVLTAGKQPRLKEADGSGQSGCRMPDTPSGAPAEGVTRLFSMDANGRQSQIVLGPGGTVQYSCRNMTMAAFAAELRRMLGVQVGPEPVIDETGLKGAWNFDVRWSIGLPLPNQSEQVPVAEAIDKQLGLKLEQRPIPKQVLLIESVSRTPTPNAANIAEVLPAPPVVKEFEVADVKLAAPPSATQPPQMIMMQMQPGGRFTCRGCPMRLLLSRAFNSNNSELLAGLPAGIDSLRVDVIAKTSSDADAGPGIDSAVIAPLLRNLLVDRFKMRYHEEERPVTAYSLIAEKPKLKKADPDSRIFCRRGQGAPGSPPGSLTLTCQNATMAFFVEQLAQGVPGLSWPVLNATGLEAGWDFSLTFSVLPPALLNAAGRGGPAGGDAQSATLPSASDPNGGYTVFEAIEKQLGLKLKAEKRNEKVIVVDHMESTPTEN